jgi:hypothetical protein
LGKGLGGAIAIRPIDDYVDTIKEARSLHPNFPDDFDRIQWFKVKWNVLVIHFKSHGTNAVNPLVGSGVPDGKIKSPVTTFGFG